MKLVKVNALQDGNILAKAVYDEKGQMMFYEGTSLHNSTIEKLKSNNIKEVYIFEPEIINKKTKIIIKQEVHSDCKNKVKTILEKHICQKSEDLKEIAEAANEIIADIFSKEEVVDRVYDIKERSADLYDHSINVSALSILTAIKLNIPREEVLNIGIGSLLHDLGLNYINVEYANVDVESLSPEALFEYKKHTLYGFSSVEREDWMTSVAKKIILFHHERINGTGYPLKQKNIPTEVKIVSICDNFDDRICGIGCKQEKVQEAIEYLKRYKDIYFDGKIVDMFLDFIAVYPIGTVVKLNTGEEAIVVEQNAHFSDKPRLSVFRNTQGLQEVDRIIDLAENRYVKIEEIVAQPTLTDK